MSESPKKYHVTDEGDVYRINDDGSFTSMGNAEKMSNSAQTAEAAQQSPEPSFHEKPIKPYAKKKRIELAVAGIILMFLLGGLCLFYIFSNPQISNIEEGSTSADTVAASIYDEFLTEIEQSDIPQNSNKFEQTKEATYQPPLSKKTEYQKQPENYVEAPYSNAKKTNSSDVIDPEKIYSAVEVQADFPGGDRARLQWLRDNIQWPRDANGKQLRGEVELNFVIERDGSISNVKVSYSENSELNNAAISLINSMPKWSPAMVKNEPVRSSMGISLFF